MVSAPYLEDNVMGNYLKLVHYADEAIGELISSLDKAGLLENTIILIYGDHDAKLSIEDYIKYYNYDPYTDSIKSIDDEDYINVDFYKYKLDSRVPFIIWTKEQQFNLEIDKIMGTYDILPTIGNMVGFDSPYRLGHDIFSDYENIVVFPNGNWITDKIYYNSQKNEYKLLSSEQVTGEYINNFEAYAKKVLETSNNIIKYDLLKDIIK